jgi:hypothetical protein
VEHQPFARRKQGLRVRKIKTRARYGRRRLKQISRTATLGGLFLSFLKIGLTGFGGGFAVLLQIRNLVVQERRWLGEHDFVEALALGQTCPAPAPVTPSLMSDTGCVGGVAPAFRSPVLSFPRCY